MGLFRAARSVALASLVAIIAACGGGGESPGATASAPVAQAPVAPTSASRTTPSNGLASKVIAGYQGWFGCPGDYQGNTVWQHWFLTRVAAANLTVDLLPAQSSIAAADLCDTGVLRADGSTLKLFSSQNPNVVRAHFAWMRDRGIDGVALQRFSSELADPVKKARADHVLANVRAAAEATGRTFYVTWDISGDGPASGDVVARLRADWKHLVDDLHITGSTAYLSDHGKPVIELWGFGFGDRPGDAPDVAALIADLKSGAGGLEASFVIGGVPSNWRTLAGDSKADPRWASVYRSYDAISPWSVGRFDDQAGADTYLQSVVVPDLAETTRAGIGYLPVTFPGFSWRNQMLNKGLLDVAILNQIPRDCGDFLWHQYANLVNAGAKSVYAAMFDEFDEGTALAPAATSILAVPVGVSMVTLDQEGCSVPEDWYLQVTGKAAAHLRNRTPLPAQIG